MSTINDFSNGADLSLAAYATLRPGMVKADYINALMDNGDGMTDAQARDFATRYTVVDQYTDLASGFSATVFQDAQGKRSLAIRGTSDVMDVIEDSALAVSGAAGRQIIAMYNYVQRLKGAKNESVAQLEWDELNGSWVLNPSGATGLLDMPLSGQIDVVGHSLGGHLAMAFGRLFLNDVAQIYTYNAPGFHDALSRDFWGSMELLTGPSSSSFQDSKTTNLYGTGLNIIADYADDHGTPQQVFLENNSHSIIPLTDSLAVYRLLNKIDADLSMTGINQLLEAASNVSTNSLESLASALSRVFQGNAAQAVGMGDRDALYAVMQGLLNDGVIPSGLGLVSLANKTAGEMQSLAQNNIAYRYALRELNSFAVLGAEYGQHNQNGQLDLYNPSTGAGSMSEQYLADRSIMLAGVIRARVADSGSGNALTIDATAANSLYFKDMASGLSLQQGQTTLDPRRIVFSSEYGETIQGGFQADHLYGMGGDDTLVGFAGEDYLEGGSGNDTLDGGKGDDILIGGSGIDTYVINRGDGHDTIVDEGRNILKIDGEIFAGVFVKVEATGDYLFIGDDENFSMVFNTAVTLTLDGSTSITFANQTSAADFEDGDFGLTLLENKPPDQFDITLTGDDSINSCQIIDFEQNGTEFFFGFTRNAIANADGSYSNFEWIFFQEEVQVDTSFMLTGGAANDMLAGLLGKDHLVGGEGNDWLWGVDLHTLNPSILPQGGDLLEGGPGNDWLNGSGADDILYGGDDADLLAGLPGKDLLMGESGNDFLVGGAADDVACGGEGDDILLGDGGLVIRADLLLTDTLSINLIYEDDYLIGMTSPDIQFDLEHPGAGNDRLFGGAGNDCLIGGLGDDILSGDEGKDVLWGDNDAGSSNGGNDSLYGGAGDDLFFGGGGSDYIYGDTENDTLFGNDGEDQLHGGSGNDGLLGGAGNDLLFGDEGDDRLWGDNGDTTASGSDGMHGGTGNDQLMGEGGNDILFGDEGDDLLLGGQGNDLLIGGTGKDSLYGGAGDDGYIFSSGDGIDYVDDREGQNLIRLDGVSTLSSLEWMHASVNTSGAISYNQTGQDIVIRYGSGNVLVISGGAAGNFTFQLGEGFVYNYNDFFDSTNEYQLYEGGNDSISCTDSNDRIYAGGGNDTVHGLGGNDIITGGNGFYMKLLSATELLVK